jgi:hypothetical protein
MVAIEHYNTPSYIKDAIQNLVNQLQPGINELYQIQAPTQVQPHSNNLILIGIIIFILLHNKN